MRRVTTVGLTTVFLLLLSSVLVVSCGKKRADQNNYKIAAILPISGPNADQGIGMMNSCKLAMKEINASGKLAPLRLELMELDDASDPSTAVKAAERAAQDLKVIAVTAHWNSGCALATNPVFHANGLVNLVPAAINSKITLEQPGDEIFRIDPHDLLIVRYAAEFAHRFGEFKTAVLIDDNTFYGKSLADEFRRDFTEQGGEVIGQESIQVGEKDFAALMTKIKPKRPDLLFFGGVVTEAALLRRQAKMLHVDAQFISLTGIYSQSFIDAAGPAAEGCYCVTVCPPTDQLLRGREFIQSYEREKFTHPYEAWGVFGYASVEVLAEAIRRASPHPTRRAVIEQLKRGTFDTILGPVSFDEHGQTKLITIYVDRVVNGLWKPEYRANGTGNLERIG